MVRNFLLSTAFVVSYIFWITVFLLFLFVSRYFLISTFILLVIN